MHIDEVTPPATAALFSAFHQELFGFVRRRVDSDAAAEDLLQTAFLKAHRHLQTGALPDHPRAWLYQIARNLLVDTRRHQARQAALGETAAADPTASAPDPAPEPEDPDTFELVARMLPAFIDTLDAPYREALRMTELEGLTQREAAERVGLSVSGMKSRVQRGRRQVYDALTDCCAFEVDGRGRVVDWTRRETGSCACG